MEQTDGGQVGDSFSVALWPACYRPVPLVHILNVREMLLQEKHLNTKEKTQQTHIFIRCDHLVSKKKKKKDSALQLFARPSNPSL